MNKAALLYVANAIEQHWVKNLGFNMGGYVDPLPDLSGHNCGTSACIAGWTVALLDKRTKLPRHRPLSLSALRKMERDTARDFFDLAAHLLDLDDEEACGLFYFGGKNGMSAVTVAEAVAEIRRLAARPDDPQES